MTILIDADGVLEDLTQKWVVYKRKIWYFGKIRGCYRMGHDQMFSDIDKRAGLWGGT